MAAHAVSRGVTGVAAELVSVAGGCLMGKFYRGGVEGGEDKELVFSWGVLARELILCTMLV